MLTGGETVLEADHVYKRFARSNRAARRQLSRVFAHALLGRAVTQTTHNDGEFWGLQNVTFSLRRGNALGVIGFNGAGKTTLLRLLNGQIMPDAGEVRIIGNTGSFIDLSAGFNNTLSGRQNIYIKSAILGRSKEEVDAVVEDIIDFAELGDFINAPVKNYSAGMLARLGFSIVAHSQPSLLLVDEILAVGDYYFRQKCLGRLREMREHCSFVLVSHNMRDIRTFCDEVIVLERGSIAFQGDPNDAIQFYEEAEKRLKGANQPEALPKKENAQVYGHMIDNADRIEVHSKYWGRPDGEPVQSFRAGEPIGIHISFTPRYVARNIRLGVPIWNEDDILVTAVGSHQRGAQVEVREGETCNAFLDLSEAAFNPGVYTALLSVADGPEFIHRGFLDPVEIVGDADWLYWGQVQVPYKWVGLTTRGEIDADGEMDFDASQADPR